MSKLPKGLQELLDKYAPFMRDNKPFPDLDDELMRSFLLRLPLSHPQHAKTIMLQLGWKEPVPEPIKTKMVESTYTKPTKAESTKYASLDDLSTVYFNMEMVENCFRKNGLVFDSSKGYNKLIQELWDKTGGLIR